MKEARRLAQEERDRKVKARQERYAREEYLRKLDVDAEQLVWC
jgi:hypothetical protein